MSPKMIPTIAKNTRRMPKSETNAIQQMMAATIQMAS